MRHLKAGARKKCTVKRSSGNPGRKRIRNRVPRPSANNVARTPSCVGPWESFELSCARFASLRPSFIVLSFLWLLLFSDARSSSSPPIAAIKERKRSQKERRTQRGGSRKRERERDKKRDEKEERDRLFSSPSWTSPCSLSRLDVIKTKPRAGPPSRRLINCFVRDTSLFKRNRALLSPPVLLSYRLDHSAHPAHPNDSYLFVQRVRTGVFQPASQRRHRGYRNLREGFDSARLVRWIEGPARKRDSDRGRRKWKSRSTVLYKVNRRESNFLAQLYRPEQAIYKVFSIYKLSAVGRGFFS